MPNQHVSSTMYLKKAASALQLGDDLNILADGDLTSLSAAKTAVDADVAVMHVSQQNFGVRVKAALDIAEGVNSTYVTGSDISDLHDALFSGETVPKGLSPVL